MAAAHQSMAQLSDQLDQLIHELPALLSRVTAAESRAASAESEVSRLRAELQLKDRELRAAEQRVELLESAGGALDSDSSDSAAAAASLTKRPRLAADLAVSNCQIERLPAELLTRILSELDQQSLSRCAQLSRRWQRLATQPHLWREIRIRRFIIRMYYDTIEIGADLTQRLADWLGKHVRHISAFDLNAEQRLPLLLAASVNLTSLTLTSIHGDSAVTVAALRCPNLQELRLRFCKKALSADLVTYLLAGCPRLSLLSVGHLDVFTDQNDPRLRRLFTLLVGRLRSLSIKFLYDYIDIFSVLPECPRLGRLASTGLSWAELLRMLRVAPSLTDLKAESVFHDPDFQAPDRLPALPGLLRLSLADRLSDWDQPSESVTDMALWLLPSLPALRVLRLDSKFIAAEVCKRVFQALPASLSELSLSQAGWPAAPG